MGLVEKLQKMWNPPDDEYDEYLEEQEVKQPEQTSETAQRPGRVHGDYGAGGRDSSYGASYSSGNSYGRESSGTSRDTGYGGSRTRYQEPAQSRTPASVPPQRSAPDRVSADRGTSDRVSSERSGGSSVRSVDVDSQGNKVVNIHATTQLQVVLFKPERFGEDTRAIADELLKTHTVVLNLENTSKDVSRRIIDFLSGVAYANNGKIKRIATSTFIITPYNVDLLGDDVLDELESSGVYF